MKTTSERMKQRMEHLGLKQADLVEMTGISKGALSSYLSGHYLPKQNNIYLISKALNVNEAWLMGLDVPMERESREEQYDNISMSITTIAQRLHTIMQERNLKQVDILNLTQPFCQKYNVKINESDISQYVSGKVKPSQDKLVILGMALNVTELWLMGFDVPKERNIIEKQYDDASRLKANNNPFANQPEQALRVLNLYNQLDSSDQDKVEGIIEGLLLNEKYSSKKKQA